MQLQRALVSLVLVLPACDEETTDPGAAPTVQSFALDTMDVSVGVVTALGGTLAFADPDGDVADAELVITNPAGAEMAVSTPVQGATGLDAGSVSIAIQFVAPTPGDYSVTLTLHDDAGNTSEPFVAVFSAS